jgi:hypothetical protein
MFFIGEVSMKESAMMLFFDPKSNTTFTHTRTLAQDADSYLEERAEVNSVNFFCYLPSKEKCQVVLNFMQVLYNLGYDCSNIFHPYFGHLYAKCVGEKQVFIIGVSVSGSVSLHLFSTGFPLREVLSPDISELNETSIIEAEKGIMQKFIELYS